MIKKLSNQGNQENQGEIKVQTMGYKQTGVGVIPEDWKVDEIQNLAEITTGAKNTQDKIEGGAISFFCKVSDS